eukprot:287229-Chlamydomonas_euryale.AAC.4
MQTRQQLCKKKPRNSVYLQVIAITKRALLLRLNSRATSGRGADKGSRSRPRSEEALSGAATPACAFLRHGRAGRTT